MHKLRKVKGAPVDYLTDIVNGKSGARGGRLKTLVPAVTARYTVLQGAYTIGGLGGVAEDVWTSDEHDDLLHCYESTTKALEDLKALILGRQDEGIRDFCPYCGIGAPRQFDHYLPKEKFPEFSVHAHNLVPCCGTCNGKKSVVWLEPNGARRFINFYLDTLPSSQMLQPVVHWSKKKGKLVPAVSFDLVRPAGFSTARFTLIETHFDKLELLARYKDQAHTEFLALRDAAVARAAKTVPTLRRFLKNYLAARKATLGPLNWRIALYEVLIQHVPFLQGCLKP